MVDTHTHLNFEVFVDDWREVVERAVAAGVEKMIVVGTDLASSKRAVEMAAEHPALFASVGIHPHHARQYIEGSKKDKILNQVQDDMNELAVLAQEKKVVAIGEVGLDYHIYINSKYQMTNSKEEWEMLKKLQRDLLAAQIYLAQKLDKPLIIHSREAGEEVLDSIASLQNDSIRGVFHCFDGSKKYLRRILEAGFYVSFTGNITFIPDRAAVAREVPLTKLLLETDCPFMLPEPLRSRKRQEHSRCEPANVTMIAKFHAPERQLQLIEVDRQTTRNAYALFGFDG